MSYECYECGNDERFERELLIREPFEKQPDGSWQGDHAEEEVIDVCEVTCTDCGAVVY